MCMCGLSLKVFQVPDGAFTIPFFFLKKIMWKYLYISKACLLPYTQVLKNWRKDEYLCSTGLSCTGHVRTEGHLCKYMY